MKNIAFVFFVGMAPTMGTTEDFSIGDLTITAPIARATTASAMTSAGYFTITNNGPESDVLLEVSANFPRVMMHDSVVNDGVAMMNHLQNGIEIPSGESVAFAPAGKHVMFMGLGGDALEVGEIIPATLIFKNAGKIEILFTVENIDGI